MAFDLFGPTLSSSIETCDQLIFDVANLSGVVSPTLDRLDEQFYESPVLNAGEAAFLSGELRAVLEAMQSKPELVQMAWEAQPEAHRRGCSRPFPGILEAKCEALLAVCEEAAHTGCGLRTASD